MNIAQDGGFIRRGGGRGGRRRRKNNNNNNKTIHYFYFIYKKKKKKSYFIFILINLEIKVSRKPIKPDASMRKRSDIEEKIIKIKTQNRQGANDRVDDIAKK